MARLMKLFLLFCLHGLLFDYEQATCSSPSPPPPPSPSSPPSPSPSPPSRNDLLCNHNEKTALLQFKRLFGENPPALITWKDEASSDCCYWDGVTCDRLTGHVIELDLRLRQLHGAIPSNSTLFHLSHLQILDLSYNDFNGSNISPAFGLNFTHLTYLDLSISNFAGSISWLTNLTELEYLDLSSNNLTGPIPTNISSLQKLRRLDLKNNLLSKTLPPDLFDIPMLVWVDLGFNRLSGPIPTTKRVQNSFLVEVMLNDNNLQGSIPGSIARLSSLSGLFLSNNNLQGSIPGSIARLSSLSKLYLSNNNLQGSIPGSIARLSSLSELFLSNNNLSGTLGPQLFPNRLNYLDLSNNSFQGQLPELPPSDMYYFVLSHNKLEGDIPLSYCHWSNLTILVLSHNNLSGVIAECITNSSSQLKILDLGFNGFHGTIPVNFPKENSVLSINLKSNRLEGKLPSSLANCRNLTVLDIGTNRIKDTFPYWLQSLQELEVLVLRNNKFHGPLGLIARTKEENPFPKLRIFDLSRNEFNGPLPSNYFHTLSSMRNINRTPPEASLYMGLGFYDDTIEITLKGVDSELPRILNIFAAIDLSDNNFEGEIPKDIGTLRGIQSLNLSHNALVGKIPSSFTNLASLESLDLSSNQLSGVIPQELTRLSFLEMLNLSSNLLTGQIPRGPQFNTFENDSYGGNSGLCGLPLSKKCFDENGTPSPGEQEADDDEDFFHAFTWKTVLLGYGCGTALGLGVGIVIFKTGRPKRLVTFVEDELLYMTTKRPRPAIVFLSEAQRRRRSGNSLS